MILNIGEHAWRFLGGGDATVLELVLVLYLQIFLPNLIPFFITYRFHVWFDLFDVPTSSGT